MKNARIADGKDCLSIECPQCSNNKFYKVVKIKHNFKK